jgi:hypothetical protein
MLEIRRNGCYRPLEMLWYGPTILAIVLFSQAGFYIFRPSTLASMLVIVLRSPSHIPLTFAYHRALQPAPSAQRSGWCTGLALAHRLVPARSS